MLALYILFLFVSIVLLSNVKNSTKTYFEPWGHPSESNFRDTKSHSGEESEHVGHWNVLKGIVISVLYSRKDPRHHETVFVKLNEHFKRCSIYNSKLKIKFFGTPAVFANSAKSIREYLCNGNCGSRIPEKCLGVLLGDESKGIMFARNDATYRELRKYTLKTLGKLGFGKNSTMSVILDDTLNDLLKQLESLRKEEGNKIQVQELFSLSVINIVWVMVGGKKFEKDDEKFHKLQNCVKKATQASLLAFAWGCAFPKFMLSIMQWFGVQCYSVRDLHRNGSAIFLEYIEEAELLARAKENFEEVEDTFIHLFLSKVEKHKNDDQLSKIYSKNQLATLLVDLFTAAVDTTSKFMESFFMYMVLHPDVQARLFLEIDEFVGDCSPSYSAHSKRMPYTQAVIMEIHRMASIVPVFMRSVSSDCTIGNDAFKKNTMVVIGQASMNLDETYWGDARIFRPERFLDADNNILTEKVNYMMPFGAGVRVCPGENAAKAAIFTLMVGILQKYTLKKSNQNEFVGICKSYCLTSGPEPFHVSLLVR